MASPPPTTATPMLGGCRLYRAYQTAPPQATSEKDPARQPRGPCAPSRKLPGQEDRTVNETTVEGLPETLTRGQLGKVAGVTPGTISEGVKRGLLPPPLRTPSGRPRWPREVVRQLLQRQEGDGPCGEPRRTPTARRRRPPPPLRPTPSTPPPGTTRSTCGNCRGRGRTPGRR